ncbi:MAG: peptidoglycan DD-metalloendopeptidase family protein [Rhizobium sp.]|nr:peptidoglycan DD-metalloendopeptidase family protein [Rhizobium sp.]
MRALVVRNTKSSSLRLAAVVLLAGVASGCSSDVTRFDGLFSSKPDTLTTNSIPHKVNAVNGKLPTPRADVTSVQARDVDVTGDQALDQPYPGNPNVSYDPISTSTIDTRSAVTPMKVERTELATANPKVDASVALRQPMPAKVSVNVDADPIKTGTVKGVWKVTDASPRVLVNSGNTLSGIAAKYRVPQAEILKANKMTSGADLKFGKSIIIPVKVDGKNDVAANVADSTRKKVPTPTKTPDEKAILPATTASRDKTKPSDSKLANAADAKGATHQVEQGDSLAKIARKHKVSVDALKAANGLETASIKIGQKLVIPGPDADPVKTASIPADSKTKDVVEAKPKSYTPPVATKSVEDVQKADTGEDAPDETGIGKFRWPVRGAVIAGYGQNVDGVRNPGIDISVPEGTPIKAAENGVVIYSGAGLKDLGNTVLVRHDNGAVTVYGNASELKVKRGEKVTRGQVIALSGMTGGAKRPKVHFEVRQNAAAVNPMTFLQ